MTLPVNVYALALALAAVLLIAGRMAYIRFRMWRESRKRVALTDEQKRFAIARAVVSGKIPQHDLGRLPTPERERIRKLAKQMRRAAKR